MTEFYRRGRTAAEMPKLYSLQVIRAVAFFIIFLFHAVRTFPGQGRIYRVFSLALGPWGVSVFFILSGFVMTYSYWNRPPAASFRSSAAFAARKIRPLYPLHLCMLAAGTFRMLLRGKGQGEILKKLLITIPLVQTWFPTGYKAVNSVAWYLSVSLFLYFVFPLIFPFMRKENAETAFLKITGIFPAQMTAGYLLFNYTAVDIKWAVYFHPLFRLGDFVVGGLLASVFINRRVRTDTANTGRGCTGTGKAGKNHTGADDRGRGSEDIANMSSGRSGMGDMSRGCTGMGDMSSSRSGAGDMNRGCTGTGDMVFRGFQSAPRSVAVSICMSFLEAAAVALCIYCCVYYTDVPKSLAWLKYSSLFMPANVLLIYVFATGEGIFSKLLSGKILFWLADISPYAFLIHRMVIYGFYDFVTQILRQEQLNYPAIVLIPFAFTTAAVYLYLFLENRIGKAFPISFPV